MPRNQKAWIELYKQQNNIKSDYQLAKKWCVCASFISQLKRDRLRMILEQKLMIAESLGIDVVEIIASIELNKKKYFNNERIKKHYFDALAKTITTRMMKNANSGFFQK